MSGIAHFPPLTALLLGIAILCSVPLIVLGFECLLALFARQKVSPASETVRPSLAVLIPAHNEVLTLGATLDAIRPQLAPADRLLVVADNCDDATAQVARNHGAEVAERFDAAARGKGFALDFGMRQLASNPPELVVLTDADCIMNAGALDVLARQVTRTGRPAQGLYLLERPEPAGIRDSISAFAFVLKNQVRPIGLQQLGLPCPLFGAGMAFPWQVLRDAPLADGNIVEDLQLGLNLVRAGQAPQFCSGARILGNLPTGGEAALTQRRRWEHGHLRTILSQVPGLVATAFRRRSLAPFVAALDVSVPPLSLLTVGVALALILSGALVLAGGSAIPLIALGTPTLFAVLALLGVWIRYGRETLPARSLLAVPFYVAWKVPMYFAFLLKPQKQWIRTQRVATPLPAAGAGEATIPGFPDESTRPDDGLGR